MPNRAKRTSIHYGGKIVRCNALDARATTLDTGARTNTAPGVNATGAIAASAPSTASPIPCCTRASGWILATFLLCLASSSRRIALEVGVPIRTSYRWCWWLRNAALSYEMPRQLEGTTPAILEHGEAVSFHPHEHPGDRYGPSYRSPMTTRSTRHSYCSRNPT
jgi:hypothetical protein